MQNPFLPQAPVPLSHPRAAEAPSRPAPSCLEFLTWMDVIIDGFNGLEDQGPKQSPLYERHACWRKSDKYECEDINDALNTFLILCAHLDIPPSKTPALRRSLRAAIALHMALPQERMHRGYWTHLLESSLQALTPAPEKPLYALFQACPRQLALRAALQADDSLAAPFPEFPLALKAAWEESRTNFRGGSEAWTRSKHEAGNWAKALLLQGMQKEGWFDSELTQPGPDSLARIAEARDIVLATHGIYVMERVKKA